MPAAKPGTPRGSRTAQPTWVWLMVLTAHRGLCVYCGRSGATTLDHETPVTQNGADIWWNFVPACADCNRWKYGRTAREWVANMDMHHRYPKGGFAKRAMRPEVYAGILQRVQKVQFEIAEGDRRDWFRHHYGDETHKTKRDLAQVLTRCTTELKGYPHKPWTTPRVRDTEADTCLRRICCGWKHPDAWFWECSPILAKDDREAFQRAAYQEGLYEGDLVGELIRRYLADRTRGVHSQAT